MPEARVIPIRATDAPRPAKSRRAVPVEPEVPPVAPAPAWESKLAGGLAFLRRRKLLVELLETRFAGGSPFIERFEIPLKLITGRLFRLAAHIHLDKPRARLLVENPLCDSRICRLIWR